MSVDSNVGGGIRICDGVPVVVVGAALDLSGPQREHRTCPVERLDQRYLVDRKHDRVVRRVEVKPYHVDDIFGDLRVPPELKGLEPMRVDIGGSPDLPHLPLLDPAYRAISRVLQWIAPAVTRSVARNRLRSTVAGR